MVSSTYNYRSIQAARDSGSPLEGIRIAGTLLTVDPMDVLAWYLGTLCLYDLGDREGAIRNMKAVIIAMARDGQPIRSIVAAKQFEEWGQDASSLIDQIAELYCADSPRLSEVGVVPPTVHDIESSPFETLTDETEILDRIREQMAVSWGQAMALRSATHPLPALPLFSTLPRDAFKELVRHFRVIPLKAGEQVIAQGEIGTAVYIVAFGQMDVIRTAENRERETLAHLMPGTLFGEMAIVSSTPRAASVISAENSVLLMADKSGMEEAAATTPLIADVLVAFCHARMLENLMRISPVLMPIPAGRRADLIARFDTGFFSRDEVIMEEGEPGTGLFLVVSGGVSVFRMQADKQNNIATLVPGDIFGEISLLLRKPSTATIIATENTAVLRLGATDFHAIVDEFPQLLKSTYDIALEREKQNVSILGQVDRAGEQSVLL